MSTRPRTSTTGLVREALAAWARAIMADTLPKAKAVGTPEGETPTLPSCGLLWSTARTTGMAPVPVDVFGDGRVVWQLHNEDTDMAFTWRAKGFDQAELIAQTFAARANIEALKANGNGSRTTNFALKLQGMDYKGRLYIEGHVEPVPMERAELRDEWTVKVPALVVYPVIQLEQLSDATGIIRSIVFDINGREYAPASLGEAP